MRGYAVGEVYWYRAAGKIYGALVPDHPKNSRDYFIGISEEVIPAGKNPTPDEILSAKPYTAAWFDVISLLSPVRMHSVGQVEVSGSYADRGGRFKSEEQYVNKNVSMKYTWRHGDRMLIPKWDCMRAMLDSRAFPKTWMY